MVSRIARTLTAVSALVLGFGPAMVQAADANNTPYTKYLDCGSSPGRTKAGGNLGCVERGEVLNFGQLRDILAAAKYREESERRNFLRPPGSDYGGGSDYTGTEGSTTLRPRINDSTTNDNSSNPNRATSIRPQDRPARSDGIVARQDRPARSDGMVVRYERGINDQNTPASRLVFTVRDEAGESSSYSVNLSDEAGQYIEREIIGIPTARPAAEVTVAEEIARPLDMEQVVVSQEMIPINSNGEVVSSMETQISVQVSDPSQPTAVQVSSPIAAQVSSQTSTTISAQMPSAPPAPALGQPTVSYFPPQITIMESSVESQPITVSYYTFGVEQQSVTSTSYTFTTQGSTASVSAEPVVTVSLFPAQASNDLTVTTTTTSTTVTSNPDTVMVRSYVIMISSTETVHVVPQQIDTSVNVLAAIDQGVTPGENVRDQIETEGRTTASFEDIGNAPAPSNNNDDDDEDDDDDDDDGPR